MHIQNNALWQKELNDLLRFDIEINIGDKACKADYGYFDTDGSLLVYGFDLNEDISLPENVFGWLLEKNTIEGKESLMSKIYSFSEHPKNLMVFLATKDKIFYMPNGIRQINSYAWNVIDSPLQLIQNILFKNIKAASNKYVNLSEPEPQENIEIVEVRKELNYIRLKYNDLNNQIKLKEREILELKLKNKSHIELLSKITLEKISHDQVAAIHKIGGKRQGVNIFEYPNNIVLKTYLGSTNHNSSESSSHDDGVALKYLDYYNWITNVNCSYFIIDTQGNYRLIYDGKIENVNIAEMSKEDIKKMKEQNEVLKLTYYQISI